jgi:hypothetical protein
MALLIAIFYGASLAILLAVAAFFGLSDWLLAVFVLVSLYAVLSVLTAKTSISDGVKIWMVPVQIASFFISVGCLFLFAISTFLWVFLVMTVILILNIFVASAVVYVAKRSG